MTAMPPLRDILNNTPADAVDVEFNFATIESHIGAELINRDGSVAMTGPLSLSGPPSAPQHATTKAYVDTNVIPIGTIWEFAGSAAPTGWAFCDGASKSTTDPAYAALFAAIGYAYGGSGANFNLPDRRGRVGVGRSAGDSLFGTLGAKGGNRDTAVINHTHDIAHNHGSVGTGTESADHVHGLGGHWHSINHEHTTPFSDGFDINSANELGATNAIFTGNGHALSFVSRATAAVASDVGQAGLATVAITNGSSGGPVGNSDGRSAAHTHTTNPISLGSTQSTNPAGGVAATDRNLQPYEVVNFIVRIG